MRNNGKVLIVVAVVIALAVEPAVACRFRLFRRRCACYTPCQPVCCAPATPCTTPATEMQGGAPTSVMKSPAPSDEVPTPIVSDPSQPPVPAPVQPVQPPVAAPPIARPRPRIVQPDQPKPAVQAPPVAASPAKPAKPAAEAPEDLFGEPPAKPAMPKPVKPAADMPEDLFGEPPAKPAPAGKKKPADDVDSLFEDNDKAAPPKSAQTTAGRPKGGGRRGGFVRRFAQRRSGEARGRENACRGCGGARRRTGTCDQTGCEVGSRG